MRMLAWARGWSVPVKRTAMITTVVVLVSATLSAVAIVQVRGGGGCVLTGASMPTAAVAFDIGAIPNGARIPTSEQSVPLVVPVGHTLLIRQWSPRCVPVTVAVEVVPGTGKPGVVRLVKDGHIGSGGEIAFFALLRGASPGLVQVDLNQPVPSAHCEADKACPASQISFPKIAVRVVDTAAR